MISRVRGVGSIERTLISILSDLQFGIEARDWCKYIPGVFSSRDSLARLGVS